MSSYIPSRDGDLKIWVDNFDAMITANPPRYGLVPADAVAIHTYVHDFDVKLVIASTPSTRTAASIADKDGARAAMLDIVRKYAQDVKANLGVSNDAKLELGIHLDDANPTPISAPATQPILALIAASSLQHTMRFSDSGSPDKRGKPAGAIGMQLFVFISTTPPTGTDDYRFIDFVTRQPFIIPFVSADGGKIAYYIARWQTATGLVSGWSNPVHMTVVG